MDQLPEYQIFHCSKAQAADVLNIHTVSCLNRTPSSDTRPLSFPHATLSSYGRTRSKMLTKEMEVQITTAIATENTRQVLL